MENFDEMESNIIQTKDENGDTQSFELVDILCESWIQSSTTDFSRML